MLKQKLQQKLLQKLSPQQIQVIKLLEIPTINLEQRIKKELEENPALEEYNPDLIKEEQNNIDEDLNEENEENVDVNENKDDVEFSIEDFLNEEDLEDDIPAYKLNIQNYSKDEKREEIPFSVGSTFHEYLISQLGLKELTEKQQKIGEYIIGNIDDDGYLRRDIESLVDDIAFNLNLNTSIEEINEVLKIIQEFDPPGVGARNLQECLLIQINQKNLKEPHIKLAKEIIEKHFEEFSKKHYDKIKQKLNISEEELKKTINEILSLNPKPGSAFTDPQNKMYHQITPDFYLENIDNQLYLSLNSKNMPELRINPTYKNILEKYQKLKTKNKAIKEALQFMKQKIESAAFFIDAIQQRQHTLMNTMQAIIDYQKEFFLTGDETKLKPMILKDIAEKTGLDVSTVSRVVNSKYIQTQFGIYPLKFFFSEGMKTEDGDEVSTHEIKKVIKELIENEDKKKPLTDEQIMKILNSKGYPIARRTVAKYREQMNIPVARLRKEL